MSWQTWSGICFRTTTIYSSQKNGKGFTYLNGTKTNLNPQTLKRIKQLVIPPGWKDVKITHLAKGHLQAVGRDEKNRKQYLYHPLWSKIRNVTKFLKMAAFGNL